ncbi:response regulator transcription factor [Nitrogeniibacter mangrovi]|uniref:Response regulator transcription factor n=1 Tax=Nitrogeniibacter mangrovi TaxID=2016596 RepID=A0A6C1B5H3_9RHOO|nr:response regulator transcription factor [Nitrogeniibacter mangrovi]QID17484.1 response regulator transcription factor [Nitrogeniibacter mangrovi]
MSGNSLANTRFVLADDHSVVRMGFRLLLEGAGATVLAEADRGQAAIEAYETHLPDALIMDVSMPGGGGLDALERLMGRHPEARVLMLSAHEDAQIPVRALKAGATGYLSKSAHPDELLRAARAVSQGRRYVDPKLAADLALAQLDGGTDPLSKLTEKEFAVFLQLAQGKSVNEVAEATHVSPSTVGTHLYHIKQKLSANNASELTLIAVRCGLIEA